MMRVYESMRGFHHIGRRGGAGTATVGALTIALVAAGCNIDNTLAVKTPDIVQLGALTTPDALPAVRAAVISDFQVAFGGSSGAEGQAQMSGLMADELFNAESFPTRIELDQRATQQENSTMLNIFRDIQRARETAEIGEQRFSTLDPTNADRPEIVALGGFTYVLLAENYCSGVPFSNVKPDGSFQFGAPNTTNQVLDVAIAKFDTAITLATAAGNTTALNLAHVGRGRALLDKGDFAGAAAAVAAVPTTFVYDILHDENSGRQNNGIFSFAQSARRFSIPDREGGNGLPFRSLGATDPRLAVRRAGTGFDNVTPLFVTAKYQSRSSPTMLASGVEARLIEAEAALNGGDDVTLLAKLNEARAATPTYAVAPASPPPPPDPIAALPATKDAKIGLLFQERAIDLFLTAHRLGDLRRIIRQYGRGAETVFPTGPYPKGGVYGNEVTFPVPFEERNNPQFDPAACDPTKP